MEIAHFFPTSLSMCGVLVDTKKDVVIIPSAAVQLGADAKFVYVMKKRDGRRECDRAATQEDENSKKGRGKRRGRRGTPTNRGDALDRDRRSAGRSNGGDERG